MDNLRTYAPTNTTLSYGEMDANWNELQLRTGKGWNDLVQDVTIRSTANAPTLTQYRDGLYMYEFSPSVMNECFTNFHVRHDYDITGGTYPGMVYPHVHFSCNTASTGVVRWGCEYSAARRGDSASPGVLAFGATQTLYFEHTINVNEQYTHHVSEAADGGGVASTGVLDVDAIILCRFFRDAAHVNDTYPDPVHLITVDVHYPCNVFATPNRMYPFR